MSACFSVSFCLWGYSERQLIVIEGAPRCIVDALYFMRLRGRLKMERLANAFAAAMAIDLQADDADVAAAAPMLPARILRAGFAQLGGLHRRGSGPQ